MTSFPDLPQPWRRPRRLRLCASDIEGGLGSLQSAESVEFVGAEGDGLRFRIRARDGSDPGSLAEAVSGLAALRGWPLRELQTQGATLEDVFRELTTREEG